MRKPLLQAAPSKENYDGIYERRQNFSLKENGSQDHANCFNYVERWRASFGLYKAKELATGAPICRPMRSRNTAKGNNLSEPITTLALIFRDVKYKDMSTLRFEQPDFDRLNSVLKNNVNWLDSAMISMKKRFVFDSTNRIDRANWPWNLPIRPMPLRPIRNDPERSPCAAFERGRSGARLRKPFEGHLYL